MNIFVSHAIKDNKLINDLKIALEPHGLNLLIAEHHSDIEHSTVTDKIEQLISSSDVALFLLTKNGFDSNFVQQEIGFIKASNIPYLQVIEDGIEKKITGFNYGKGYIKYSPEEPAITIEKIMTFLLDYLKEVKHKRQELVKQNQRKQIEHQKQRSQEKALIIGVGILAGVLILGLIND